jgi:glycosyltransferase involved in cell wall biosynthesis
MEARVRTLGIERNVVFTGFHQHPEQLIALADIGLIASVREGLPRVLMQYLAGGTPIVATDLPCIDDVLRPDVNGLVVGSDDLDGLADAVVALLEDPARRARLARGAAATELSEWDVSRMGERLEAIYAEVIRERRRRPVRQPGVSVTS